MHCRKCYCSQKYRLYILGTGNHEILSYLCKAEVLPFENPVPFCFWTFLEPISNPDALLSVPWSGFHWLVSLCWLQANALCFFHWDWIHTAILQIMFWWQGDKPLKVWSLHWQRLNINVPNLRFSSTYWNVFGLPNRHRYCLGSDYLIKTAALCLDRQQRKHELLITWLFRSFSWSQ